MYNETTEPSINVVATAKSVEDDRVALMRAWVEADGDVTRYVSEVRYATDQLDEARKRRADLARKIGDVVDPAEKDPGPERAY